MEKFWSYLRDLDESYACYNCLVSPKMLCRQSYCGLSAATSASSGLHTLSGFPWTSPQLPLRCPCCGRDATCAPAAGERPLCPRLSHLWTGRAPGVSDPRHRRQSGLLIWRRSPTSRLWSALPRAAWARRASATMPASQRSSSARRGFSLVDRPRS